MSRHPQIGGGPLGGRTRVHGEKSVGQSVTKLRASLDKPDRNLCTYSSYECSSEKLSGYEFCLRHILCDKNAPFKPCGYCGDSQSGVKCSRPAPYYNRGESYCGQHTRVILAERQRSRKRKTTPNVLLDSLAPYKKTKNDQSGDTSLRPFQQQREDPESEGLAVAALESHGIQTDREDMTVSDTWTGGEAESEGESVDSDAEDPLQHAGVYTVEEVMRTLKDKLVKLQKLYIDQFQRLVYKMKESRREYLSQLREEKEAGLINIFDQPNRDMEYERLKAMMHYYSLSGREALLATKHREKRLAQSGVGSKQTSFCQHTLTTTTKCNLPCIPMAKFCMKHILEEPGQVLYRACGAVTPADGPCETPVAALLQQSTCVYHTKLPVLDLREKKDDEVCTNEEANTEPNPVNSYDRVDHQDVKNGQSSTDLSISNMSENQNCFLKQTSAMQSNNDLSSADVNIDLSDDKNQFDSRFESEYQQAPHLSHSDGSQSLPNSEKNEVKDVSKIEYLSTDSKDSQVNDKGDHGKIEQDSGAVKSDNVGDVAHVDAANRQESDNCEQNTDSVDKCKEVSQSLDKGQEIADSTDKRREISESENKSQEKKESACQDSTDKCQENKESVDKCQETLESESARKVSDECAENDVVEVTDDDEKCD